MSTPFNPLERATASELVAEIERRITWRGPEVDEGFIAAWAHVLAPINPETYMGSFEQTQKIRMKYIRKLLREAGVRVKEEK